MYFVGVIFADVGRRAGNNRADKGNYGQVLAKLWDRVCHRYCCDCWVGFILGGEWLMTVVKRTE